MVGTVANLDNYDEDELRELERYIEIRREELDPNTPPSTKEISCLVHDLLLDCDPSEYAAGLATGQISQPGNLRPMHTG